MIDYFEEDMDCLPSLSEERRRWAMDVAERLALVLDYMSKGKQVSQTAMPEVVEEAMGRRQEKRIMEMRESLVRARAAAQRAQRERAAAQKRMMWGMHERHCMILFDDDDEKPQMPACADPTDEHLMHSDGGLMKTVVRKYLASNDFAVLQVLNDTILKKGEGEWEGFSGLRREIEEAALQQIAGNKGTRVVTRGDLGKALIRLFETKGYEGEPLFAGSSDWVAVFRVAIDVGLVQDNAYADFVTLIKDLKLPSLPKTLSKTNISNAYDGIYTKPVREWTEKAYLKSRTTKSVRLEYFRRKRRIAQILLDLLN